MLTNIALKAMSAQTKPYKRSDGGGLFILVQPNGSKRWCQSDANSSPLGAIRPGRHISGHEVLPLAQGSGATRLVNLTVDEVAFGIKVIVQGGMD